VESEQQWLIHNVIIGRVEAESQSCEHRN